MTLKWVRGANTYKLIQTSDVQPISWTQLMTSTWIVGWSNRNRKISTPLLVTQFSLSVHIPTHVHCVCACTTDNIFRKSTQIYQRVPFIFPSLVSVVALLRRVFLRGFVSRVRIKEEKKEENHMIWKKVELKENFNTKTHSGFTNILWHRAVTPYAKFRLKKIIKVYFQQVTSDQVYLY